MKVVINACYGGFSLSEKAVMRYAEIKGLTLYPEREIPRNDPALVQVVQELGVEASGRCAALVIVEIPDGVAWQIEEYDGYEHVAEKHRTWQASPN